MHLTSYKNIFLNVLIELSYHNQVCCFKFIMKGVEVRQKFIITLNRSMKFQISLSRKRGGTIDTSLEYNIKFTMKWIMTSHNTK